MVICIFMNKFQLITLDKLLSIFETNKCKGAILINPCPLRTLSYYKPMVLKNIIIIIKSVKLNNNNNICVLWIFVRIAV